MKKAISVSECPRKGKALSFTAIGNRKPAGICGSGIIDLLAQMRLNGWINIAGELNQDASNRIVYLEEEPQYAAIHAPPEESASGQPLYFSRTDTRQYLGTKAAAYTMVECLLETEGVTTDDLSRLYLSGAFTAHPDPESAITTGIFPDLPRENYCVQFSSIRDFPVRMQGAKFIPHTDMSRYPSI